MKGSTKEWVFRFILLATSVVFSLAVVEVLLTVFLPLYGGRDNVTLDGQPIDDWFPPAAVYRQVSNEYDARTTITALRHRVPGSAGNPDVVFLGDSFTYGFGLNDDETFSHIYCSRAGVSCANLGLPGSGTMKQLRRLEQFLTDFEWKPREVKLFFFGMSGSLSAGNDFFDNYNFGRRFEGGDGDTAGARAVSATSVEIHADKPGLAGRIIGAQELLLNRSNLIRRVKFHWGPLLKTLLIDPPPASRMRDALRYTHEALTAFDTLSRRVGFDYTIYLIVPVQDVARGSFGATLHALNSVSPRPAISTAQLFVDRPDAYYYAYDGHLNARGSSRVAEFLLESDHVRRVAR